MRKRERYTQTSNRCTYVRTYIPFDTSYVRKMRGTFSLFAISRQADCTCSSSLKLICDHYDFHRGIQKSTIRLQWCLFWIVISYWFFRATLIFSWTLLWHAYMCQRSALNSRDDFSNDSFDPVIIIMFIIIVLSAAPFNCPYLFLSSAFYRYVVPKSYFPCIYHSAYREGANQYLFFFVLTPINHSYTHRQRVSRSHYHKTSGFTIHQSNVWRPSPFASISNSDFPVGSKPIAKKFRK
jgi:hypothetical protein